MWLINDCFGIQTVYESNKKAKIENSGTQTGICESMVCMSYTRKKSCVKLYNDPIFAVSKQKMAGTIQM